MSSSGDRIKKGQRMNFCLKVCGPEVPPRESLVLGKSSENHPHQRLCLVWSGLISEKGRKWRGQDPFCITRDLESCLPTQITHHYSVFALTLFCPLNHELVKVLSKSLFLFPHPAQCLTHTCVCVCACVRVYVCAYVCMLVWLFVTPWTVPRQAPLSMGFSRQEYWSGLSCPPPGGLPDAGMALASPALQADSPLSVKHQAFSRHVCWKNLTHT